MFRLIGLMIAAVIAISVLRGLIGAIGQIFGNFTVGPKKPNYPPPGPRPSETGQPEALKKDPVCGTFVAPSTALHKRKDGQIYYFCSPECRDKFV
ncbi:MAG: YHS domain-containing protein [Acidobacteriota bacterium]